MYESTSPLVLAESCGAVLRLWLNRPERRNALTYAMIEALTALLREAADDGQVRVVLIGAVGADFCIGDDREEMGDWPARLSHRRPTGSHGPGPLPEQDLLRTLRQLPRPTIAALQGGTLALGLDLACACDIRLCADDASLGDPRILEARHSATGITYVLPRLVGQSQAMRMLLLGEQIDGPEAERIGLVYRSVPPDAFEAEVKRLTEAVAAMATRSYALIKQQILDELDMSYETALMHSLAIRQTNVIEDRAEGQRAFIEKRAPRFSGR